MNQNKKRIMGLFVASLVLFFVSNSGAVTHKEAESAIEKASKLTKQADQHQEKLLSLEEKLQEAIEEEAKTRRHLEEISSSGKATQIDIQQAEMALKRTNQKIAKLTSKLEKHRPETERVKREADEAVAKAKKLASQKEYEVATKKLEEAQNLLKFYESKVTELESEEREVHAEVLARETIAQRSASQWDRWLNTWNEKLARTKSNSLLDELSNYREKIKQTKREIGTAKTRLKEAEKDNITYNQP